MSVTGIGKVTSGIVSNVKRGIACSMKVSQAGGGKAIMKSAVKENTLKLFCESEINRLINALSARDGCGHGAQQQGSAVAE